MAIKFILALLLLSAPAAAQTPPSRCDGESAEDRLRRVEEHGDLATGSGRLLKLADIRLGEGAQARLAAFQGEPVALGTAGSADRWGRVPARVVLARDGTDLATLLLREGLASVDAGESGALCRPALFGAEADARTARRGIWTSLLVPAREPDAIAARVGRFTVVEGMVVSVGERARWVYLNFGRDFGRDFAVSVSRRNWEAMRLAGLSADGLKGRRIRVRGIVDMRRAPTMEIASADMIEWRDETDASQPDRRVSEPSPRPRRRGRGER